MSTKKKNYNKEFEQEQNNLKPKEPDENDQSYFRKRLFSNPNGRPEG